MHMSAKISGSLLKAYKRPGEPDWRRLGNELRLRIITRTRQRNVDADGAPFEAYSEGYAKAKAKKGGLATRVNLTGVRGGARMLDNIAVRAQAQGNPVVELFFALAEKGTIAQYHMGEGRVDRLFFALGDDDINHIHDFVRRLIAAR